MLEVLLWCGWASDGALVYIGFWKVLKEKLFGSVSNFTSWSLDEKLSWKCCTKTNLCNTESSLDQCKRSFCTALWSCDIHYPITCGCLNANFMQIHTKFLFRHIRSKELLCIYMFRVPCKFFSKMHYAFENWQNGSLCPLWTLWTRELNFQDMVYFLFSSERRDKTDWIQFCGSILNWTRNWAVYNLVIFCCSCKDNTSSVAILWASAELERRCRIYPIGTLFFGP